MKLHLTSPTLHARIVLASTIALMGLLGAGILSADMVHPATVAYPAGCELRATEATPMAPTPFLSIAEIGDATATPSTPAFTPATCANPIRVEHLRGEHLVAPGGTVTYGMRAVNESEEVVSFRLEITTSADGWSAWLAVGDGDRVITLMPGEAIAFDIVVMAAPYASLRTVNDTRVTAIVVEQ